MDNLVVRGKIIPNWLVVQSSPSAKASFLQNLLKQKFPNYGFRFSHWPAETLKAAITKTMDGIILELKTLGESTLSLYDRIHRLSQGVPKILVLTPSAYQWLTLKRKESLNNSLVLLSDIKSLDYILQLPRFIEDVGRKKRLLMQNERLQRLVQKRIPHFHAELATEEPIEDQRIIADLLSLETPPCGLRLRLRSWPKIKDSLGATARNEVVELLSRLINGAVRNTDRVLRSAEDEFMIFLSNANTSHVTNCKKRLEQAFEGFKIKANRKALKLPVQIRTLSSVR